MNNQRPTTQKRGQPRGCGCITTHPQHDIRFQSADKSAGFEHSENEAKQTHHLLDHAFTSKTRHRETMQRQSSSRDEAMLNALLSTHPVHRPTQLDQMRRHRQRRIRVHPCHPRRSRAIRRGMSAHAFTLECTGRLWPLGSSEPAVRSTIPSSMQFTIRLLPP